MFRQFYGVDCYGHLRQASSFGTDSKDQKWVTLRLTQTPRRQKRFENCVYEALNERRLNVRADVVYPSLHLNFYAYAPGPGG